MGANYMMHGSSSVPQDEVARINAAGGNLKGAKGVDASQFRRAAELGVTKINIDENPDIAGKFGVSSIPTLLIFKGGEVVDRFVGVQPKNRLQDALDEVGKLPTGEAIATTAGKLKAVELTAARITDPQNSYKILDHFDFDADKQKAQKLLK